MSSISEEIEKEMWKFALRNSVLHEGKARIDSVLGKLMAEHGELEPKEVKEKIKSVVKEVNSLPLEAQKNEAERLNVSLESEIKKEEKGLPELKGAEEGGVITRAAPNPNGPLHLGSARAFLLSYFYAKRYNGRFILRYDDTDPRTEGKKPEKKFYEWIKEDLSWLGCKPDLTVYASDRMDTYYEIAYELLEKGKAYICICKQEKWKKLRDKGKACKCRELGVEKNLERWEKLFEEYEEGEAVMRIKTDLKHKNPALRDWAALRIIEKPEHPRVDNEYRVWPLYNLASAIDDHELNVTHIMRAQEHSTNTEKQKYLYKHLGWKYPHTIHHGRLSLKDKILSTSKIREGLTKGEFESWDDPRLGTIRALKRRGFEPESIRELIKKIGTKSSDVNVAEENLASINRKIIDRKSNRYFFLSNPMEIKLKNPIKKGEIEIPRHPDDPKRGNRTLEVGEWVFVDKEDFEKYSGKTVRLKGLYNIELKEEAEVKGNEIVQAMPKIQWIPVDQKFPCTVVLPDNSTIHGIAENNLKNEKVGNQVQFIRFGFVRIDEMDEEEISCYFAHR